MSEFSCGSYDERFQSIHYQVMKFQNFNKFKIFQHPNALKILCDHTNAIQNTFDINLKMNPDKFEHIWRGFFNTVQYVMYTEV